MKTAEQSVLAKPAVWCSRASPGGGDVLRRELELLRAGDERFVRAGRRGVRRHGLDGRCAAAGEGRARKEDTVPGKSFACHIDLRVDSIMTMIPRLRTSERPRSPFCSRRRAPPRATTSFSSRSTACGFRSSSPDSTRQLLDRAGRLRDLRPGGDARALLARDSRGKTRGADAVLLEDARPDGGGAGKQGEGKPRHRSQPTLVLVSRLQRDPDRTARSPKSRATISSATPTSPSSSTRGGGSGSRRRKSPRSAPGMGSRRRRRAATTLSS